MKIEDEDEKEDEDDFLVRQHAARGATNDENAIGLALDFHDPGGIHQ
jgi:hypothetical protein